MVAPWRETRAFGVLRSLIARRLHYPPLTPELRARLAAHYAADVARLSELLGRDLSMWTAASVSAPHAADGHAAWGPPAMPGAGTDGSRPAA